MCAVLSQAKNHKEAIKHAQIGSFICEDNLYKTYLLCKQINNDFDKEKVKKDKSPTREKHDSNRKNKNLFEKEVFYAFKEKNAEAEKILSNILKKINELKFSLSSKEHEMYNK